VTDVVDDIEGIGERLRYLREQHRYSVRHVAEIAGVSPSMVSSVERGKVEPSLSTLRALAGAFDVTMNYFLTPTDASAVRVIRGDARPIHPNVSKANDGDHVAVSSKGVRLELASPPEAMSVEVTFQKAEPGAWLGGPPVHDGEEWGMVLSGRLKVIVGEEVHFLDAGDSIWFPGSIPHSMENVSKVTAEYIWMELPTKR
jgi:transcriptional regulator with XRE-family HTH domain